MGRYEVPLPECILIHSNISQMLLLSYAPFFPLFFSNHPFQTLLELGERCQSGDKQTWQAFCLIVWSHADLMNRWEGRVG